MPLKLFQLAELEKIKVEFFDFKQPIMGLYWVGEEMPPLIGLDKSLESNIPLLRTIFAEELGHHFTSAGSCIPKQFYNYTDRLTISKVEFKALKWAALYLMPKDKLEDALQAGYKDILGLAEHFNVTQEFVTFRIKLLYFKISK